MKTSLGWIDIKISFLIIPIALVVTTAQISVARSQSSSSNAAATSEQGDDVATQLDWVADKNCGKCRGYYRKGSDQTLLPKTNSHDDPLAREEVEICSAELLTLKKRGTNATMRGKALLRYHGQILQATHVELPNIFAAKKLATIRAYNPLKIIGVNNLIFASQGEVDLERGTYDLRKVLYRIRLPKMSELEYAWGTAEELHLRVDGNLKGNNIIYSHCAPKRPSWYIKAKHLAVNKNLVKAYHSLFMLGNVPFFYLPYFEFSLDSKARRSGFLMPEVAYSKGMGLGLGIPYYFNLAPNYDLLITPTLLMNRGLFLKGGFRYLWPYHAGEFKVGYAEKKDQHRPHFSKINWEHRANWPNHWYARVIVDVVNNATQAYDFSGEYGFKDQLLNQLEVGYEAEHWNLKGKLQGFQTLRVPYLPVNLMQYRKLPQIIWSGHYPQLGYGLDLSWRGDATYFRLPKEEQLVVGQKVDGSWGLPVMRQLFEGLRLGMNIKLRRVVSWSGGEFAPSLELFGRYYSLEDTAQSIAHRAQSRDKTILPTEDWRLSPVIAVQNSTVWGRDLRWLQQKYRQKLEAKIAYLWSPQSAQDHLPLFDTLLLPLRFDRLFYTNRFIGGDRISQGSRLVMALTTQVISSQGEEILKAGLGQVLSLRSTARQYFTPSAMASNWKATAEYEPRSPFVAQLKYKSGRHLSGSIELIGNPWQWQWSDANAGLKYATRTGVVDLWYHRAFGAKRPLEAAKTPVRHVGCTMKLPMGEKWSILGSGEYNLIADSWQHVLVGVEYSGCCWAVRAAIMNMLASSSSLKGSYYDTLGYVQLHLKGLGNKSFSNLSTKLRRDILSD